MANAPFPILDSTRSKPEEFNVSKSIPIDPTKPDIVADIGDVAFGQ